MNSFYPSNKAPLVESAFSFLPLGTIKPKGWLKRQLRIQADSLTGSLPKFWEDLGPNSGWLGGDGESWERGPYYMDGLIPIAFLLEDEELIESAKKWVDWTLENQRADGWIGPEKNTDWWPLGVMLKVLTQYQEATGDPRVIPLMQKFFAHMKEELPKKPLVSWAIYRWADTAICVTWLYNRTGDESLLDLAKLLMRQGYDWARHFVSFEHKNRSNGQFKHSTHIVNNAMGLKTPRVMYELTGDTFYQDACRIQFDTLDTYHGQATGMFTGDEHLAGKNPSQGTELCAVVEAMFSLELLEQTLGDPWFGDRLEKITFNALPATFSPDMWVHQYDQQANQVLCKNDEDRIWVDNLGDANCFGVEPNFGCCTANYHQGWPKFTSHLWMATPDDGLAAIAYAPCEVKAKVRGGVEVTIDVETSYPFEETITIKVITPQPVTFPMKLRIPEWADGPSVTVNDEVFGPSGSGFGYRSFLRNSCRPRGRQAVRSNIESGKFATIEREWKDGDVIELTFPMKIAADRRFNGSITLSRGPLVYSMVVGEKWAKYGGEEPHADYEVYPTTPWNFGIVLDTENPEKSIDLKTKPMGDPVFSPEGAPIEMYARGRIIPEWQIQHNVAGMLPESPVASNEPIQTLRLIPYGCTTLRITEFPLLEE